MPAYKNVQFTLPFNASTTSRTWTATVRKDAGAIASCSNAVVEVGSNAYYLILTASEMNGDMIDVVLTETNNPTFNTEAEKLEVLIETSTLYGDPAGSIVFTYTCYTASDLLTALPGVSVTMTNDALGTITYGTQTADLNGQTRWIVRPSVTYYFWRSLPGYTFSNPDIEQAS